ncbi:MAG: sodium:proton antiporter, partial [Desulfovibrionaceae bacterium]|nr:sodium:proton antiporter [Desulfovibrionaceae bacterium]
LYTVAGGIRLKGTLIGTPSVNTGLLFLGTCIASITGTTGAAILLIRPLLNANKERKYKVHSVVFFIFLVANIGGSLTPLGDPPLFLGFLNGVSFFWTTKHLFFPMLLTSLILLIIYLVVDTLLYRKEIAERPVTATKSVSKTEPLSIEGQFNFALLGVIIAMVLLSGFWKPGIVLMIKGIPVELQNIVRDVMLIITAFVSLKVTDQASRDANGFTWFPIEEVGKLFIGIFITMIAPIAILKAGKSGALQDLISLVSSPNGEPVNAMYFWLTGMLSSFLDNAPTYLVFFNTAGGDATLLMESVDTLLAVSMGAVFMGANSYIGNAPNFMVRSIAEDQGVAMPSFFGYLLWSFGILIPIFIFLTVLFF